MDTLGGGEVSVAGVVLCLREGVQLSTLLIHSGLCAEPQESKGGLY